MLRIDLAELVRQPGKHIDEDIHEFPPSDDDVVYLEPVVGKITVTNGGELLLVRGHIAAVVRFECGRCLGEVRQSIDADLEEQFTLVDVEAAGYHNPLAVIVPDEENEVPPGLMDGTVIDLNVLIRQAVILNSPLSPLCKEECLGLCPTCGKNRNDPSSGCACAPVVRHTPLAALRALLPGDGGDEGGGGVAHNGHVD